MLKLRMYEKRWRVWINEKTYIVRYRKVESMGFWNLSKNINTQDEFYKKFSPGNIRKWLFRFLLKENPLQDVLVLMNIPISNISNYISDEEMIEFTTDKLSKGKK